MEGDIFSFFRDESRGKNRSLFPLLRVLCVTAESLAGPACIFGGKEREERHDRVIVTAAETDSYFLHLDKNQFPQRKERWTKERESERWNGSRNDLKFCEIAFFFSFLWEDDTSKDVFRRENGANTCGIIISSNVATESSGFWLINPVFSLSLSLSLSLSFSHSFFQLSEMLRNRLVLILLQRCEKSGVISTRNEIPGGTGERKKETSTKLNLGGLVRSFVGWHNEKGWTDKIPRNQGAKRDINVEASKDIFHFL